MRVVGIVLQLKYRNVNRGFREAPISWSISFSFFFFFVIMRDLF